MSGVSEPSVMSAELLNALSQLGFERTTPLKQTLDLHREWFEFIGHAEGGIFSALVSAERRGEITLGQVSSELPWVAKEMTVKTPARDFANQDWVAAWDSESSEDAERELGFNARLRLLQHLAFVAPAPMTLQDALRRAFHTQRHDQ
jgi:hypothetical protein